MLEPAIHPINASANTIKVLLSLLLVRHAPTHYLFRFSSSGPPSFLLERREPEVIATHTCITYSFLPLVLRLSCTNVANHRSQQPERRESQVIATRTSRTSSHSKSQQVTATQSVSRSILELPLVCSFPLLLHSSFPNVANLKSQHPKKSQDLYLSYLFQFSQSTFNVQRSAISHHASQGFRKSNLLFFQALLQHLSFSTSTSAPLLQHLSFVSTPGLNHFLQQRMPLSTPTSYGGASLACISTPACPLIDLLI